MTVLQGLRAFYSDPHFGHENIIRYARRPFRDVEHMDEELVARYNAVIQDPEDLVIWCGDCFFGPVERAAELMRRLHGRKMLVRGNHDRWSRTKLLGLGFEVVTHQMQLQLADRPIVVSHYPYNEQRRPSCAAEVLIHGHIHAPMRRRGNMIHVGVDAWKWGPALLENVVKLVERVP